jgi:hypothetical protein
MDLGRRVGGWISVAESVMDLGRSRRWILATELVGWISAAEPVMDLGRGAG